MSGLFQKHRALLDKAIDACTHRYAWTAYPESPSSRIHGKEIPAQAKEDYAAMVGRPFEMDLPGSHGLVGEEVSPYTREPLGIGYPRIDPAVACNAARDAMPAWRDADVATRVGICLEMLDRLGQAPALFVNAHATMHTAGQSFIMAFAGCGANALDRGLEGLAYAWKAMRDVPATATWERQFGAPPAVTLEKRYRLMPRGVNVVITCATFPQWNGYPAIMASLATGNAVVVKPHPNCLLPVALFVRTMREVLADEGFDPGLVTMVADTRSEPATIPLLDHPATAIVDFTGGPAFGAYIEKEYGHLQVYTETAGCNSVVIESTDDFGSMCRWVAHSMCQASAQMCTSVQNIFVPRDGIVADGDRLSFEEVASGLVDAVESHIADPKHTAFLCGALVDDSVQENIDRVRDQTPALGSVLRDSAPYAHPEYPVARTATPLVVATEADNKGFYGREHFGPVSFLIATDDAEHALSRATEDVREHGAITSHVYSANPGFQAQAAEAYADAGASLSINLVGMPINFAAAYGDYHVTGLNPAGNACLTDLAFVAGRFRIVQQRWNV